TNPVIQNQSVVGEISQSQESDTETSNSSEQTDEQFDNILKQTIEEQMVKASQEAIKTEELETDKIYLVVDVMPQFPGGRQAMLKFLTNTMNYPADAQRRKVQGQVVCSFVVDTDGSIINIEVVQKIDPVLDREAVRILKQMPKWSPGERLGKPVKVRFSIPFNFGI
ncbi:MAG: energy transducer TonB, partial [Paludibacter sp.]|nr:energy transducer TonB [Paludibacter sp.]